MQKIYLTIVNSCHRSLANSEGSVSILRLYCSHEMCFLGAVFEALAHAVNPKVQTESALGHSDDGETFLGGTR